MFPLPGQDGKCTGSSMISSLVRSRSSTVVVYFSMFSLVCNKLRFVSCSIAVEFANVKQLENLLKVAQSCGRRPSASFGATTSVTPRNCAVYFLVVLFVLLSSFRELSRMCINYLNRRLIGTKLTTSCSTYDSPLDSQSRARIPP